MTRGVPVLVGASICLSVASGPMRAAGPPQASRSPQRALLDQYCVALAVGGLRAQQPPSKQPNQQADDGQAHAEHVVIESMSHDHVHDNPHLRLTTRRPERPGDRKRAEAIVAALRPSIEQYRDYRVALQNGYTIFMPDVPQSIYHFTNYLQAFAETFRFTPGQATALLYRKTRGGYELAGAMYTAPPNTPEAELDMRVPLSVTQWHAHVNICLPPRGTAAAADWKQFGPEGSITTPEACAAAKGRFFPQLFGWMVHVYPFEGTMEKIWAME